MNKFLISSVVAGALMAVPALAQPPDWDHPPEAPQGYSDYYHEQMTAPDIPARWGFRRGYDDGMKDREKGHSFRPTEGEHFREVPEIHNTGMNRNEIKEHFRQAYMHGYERGFGPH